MKTKTLLLAIIFSCSLCVMANSNEEEALPAAVVEQLNEMGHDDLSKITIVSITKNKDGSTTYTLRLNDSDGGYCIIDNIGG